MNSSENDLNRLFDFLLGEPVDPEQLKETLGRLVKNPDALFDMEDDSRLLEAVAAMNEGLILPEMKAILDNEAVLSRLFPEIMERLNFLRSFPNEPELELTPYPTLAATHQSSPFVEWIKVAGGEFQRLKEEVLIRISTLLPPPVPALSFAGLKSKKLPVNDSSAGSSRIHLDPEQTGGAEIEALLQRGADEGQPASLIVRVIIPERWPQLDGIVVKAKSRKWQAEGVTDAEGEFTFRDVPAETENNLEISVVLPKS